MKLMKVPMATPSSSPWGQTDLIGKTLTVFSICCTKNINKNCRCVSMLFLLFSLTSDFVSICELMKYNLLIAVERMDHSMNWSIAIDFGGVKALCCLGGHFQSLAAVLCWRLKMTANTPWINSSLWVFLPWMPSNWKYYMPQLCY